MCTMTRARCLCSLRVQMIDRLDQVFVMRPIQTIEPALQLRRFGVPVSSRSLTILLKH
jgi:hypothetical protein